MISYVLNIYYDNLIVLINMLLSPNSNDDRIYVISFHNNMKYTRTYHITLFSWYLFDK